MNGKRMQLFPCTWHSCGIQRMRPTTPTFPAPAVRQPAAVRTPSGMLSGLGLSLRFALCLAVLSSLLLGQPRECRAETPATAVSAPVGRLELQDGSVIAGQFAPEASPEQIRWQGTGFVTPFVFPSQHVQSVLLESREEQQPPDIQPNELLIELTNDDLLIGELLSWEAGRLRLRTETCGELTFEEGHLKRVWFDHQGQSPISLLGQGLNAWEKVQGDWHEQGQRLSCRSPRGSLQGDFTIPDQALFELDLAWESSPEFSVRLGVDLQAGANSLHGLALECWNKQLVLLADREHAAQLTPLLRLEDKSQVRMKIYFDQLEHRVWVIVNDQAPREIPLKQLQARHEQLRQQKTQPAPPTKEAAPRGGFEAFRKAVTNIIEEQKEQPRTRNGIVIESFGAGLTLNQLRVLSWNGAPPQSQASAEWYWKLRRDETLTGPLAKFSAESRELEIRSEPTGIVRQLPLDSLLSLEIGQEIQQPEPATRAILHNRMQFSGVLAGIDSESLSLRISYLDDPLRIPLRELQYLVPARAEQHVPPKVTVTLTEPDNNSPSRPFSRAGQPAASSESSARQGHLLLEGTNLQGELVDAVHSETASCLVWKPALAELASPLQHSASGRIVYRVATQKTEASPNSTQPVPAQPEQRQADAVNVFQRIRDVLQNRNAPGAGARPATPSRSQQPHELHLITGDMFPCRFVSANSEQVVVSLDDDEPRTIPASRVKALLLSPGATLPELSEEKRKRLLTVPRNQQHSPPTHLLSLKNGDFLRCRLLHWHGDTLQVELHLEQQKWSTRQIDAILWLHPENLMEKQTNPAATPAEQTAADTESTADSLPESASAQAASEDSDQRLLAQVLLPDGNRTTFRLQEFRDGKLHGDDELLGSFQFPLRRINQLLFGKEIENASLELKFGSWVPRSAPLPLFLDESDEEATSSARQSAFVGQPAPEFSLKQLDGKRFQLKQQRGKILVLDFWASWCGPCMQSMPLLHAALEEFDEKQVQLISINLEEREEQVQELVERLGWSQQVLLDIDGAVARRYQVTAIPQLFVIDQQGEIAGHVVGGGPKGIEEISRKIRELQAP